MDELVFTVDVDFTDRSVRDGAFVQFTKTVAVLAADGDDATLAACQVVACLIGVDDMVIGHRIAEVSFL